MAITSALIPIVTLLVPDDWADMHAAQAYSSGLLQPLEAALDAAGLRLGLFRLNTSDHTSDVQAFEEYLAANQPAAIIVARVLEQDPLIDVLRSEQIPFVIFGHNDQMSSLEWVDIDNTAAFWLATRKCIDLGHRRIALLNGPDAFSYARRRELGYRRALLQSNIEIDEQLVINGHPTFAMGSVMATYLLRQEKKPTAMICTTDEMALGAMSACRDLGLEIGREISIVGYGHTLAGAQAKSALASVGYDAQRVASRLAAAVLYQLRPARYKRPDERRLLSVYWVAGESLGPAQSESSLASETINQSPESLELRDQFAAYNRSQQIVHAGSWRYYAKQQMFKGSPEFYAIFGAPRDEPIHISQITKHFTSESKTDFETAWKSAPQGRGLRVEVEARLNGFERFFQWKGEFLTKRDQLIFAEGVVQEITSLVQVRRDLEKSSNEALDANLAKDQFLANISHEIRTPIHAVMGLTSLLERELKGSGPASDIAVKITQASSSLLNIINDILLISKVKSNNLELEDFQFDLQQVVDEITASAEGLLSNKAVNFKAQAIDSTYRYLYGDPQRLKQVLINLVGNACKFTVSGEVELRISRAPADRVGLNAALLFEVIDTGIGIDTSRLKEVFDPFAQTDRSISRRYGGTGLGLSIARSLVEMMGGEISVESEIGRGSRFYFELNFRLGTDNTANLGPADRLVVMIVDDSGTDALNTAEVVRQLGWLPVIFESGQSALTELEMQPSGYDLVLIDDQMLGMSGYELAGEIRSIPGGNSVGLVLLTANVDESLADPMSNYVNQRSVKPLTAEALINIVGNIHPVGLNEEAQPDSLNTSLEGVRVVAIDDSEINLELLADMLSHQGVEVECYSTGQEALSQLALKPRGLVDAILCDLQMPIMDGFEFTARLRGLDGYESTPVAAVSAGVSDLTQQQVKDAGISAFLLKPFSIQQLTDLVSGLVGSKTEPASVQEREVETTDHDQIFSSDSALKNWSNERAFMKQLKLFTERYEDTAFAVKLLRVKDYESALNYAHKLKGVASVLGLERLANIAKQLEFALRLPGDQILAQEALDLATQLQDSHAESIKVLTYWLEQHSEPSLVVEQTAPVELDQLLAALRDADPVAAEVCLHSAVEGVPDEVLQSVRDAVTAFDFNRALVLLSNEGLIKPT